MTTTKEFLCIAHRGAMGHEPENTLRSFAKALELGATWIELDVYLIDKQLIVFHDDTLERTTNGIGRIFDKSFDELRLLDAGKGEKIPTLEEVFNLLNKRAGINIELKGPGTVTAVATLISEQIKKGWNYDQLLVSSFDHRALAEMRRLAPQVRIGVLLYGVPADNAAVGQALGAYSINPSLDFVDNELVTDAHQRGLKVFVYTVNSKSDLARMASLGVDGVFCNYPERILKVRQKGA